MKLILSFCIEVIIIAMFTIPPFLISNNSPINALESLNTLVNTIPTDALAQWYYIGIAIGSSILLFLSRHRPRLKAIVKRYQLSAGLYLFNNIFLTAFTACLLLLTLSITSPEVEFNWQVMVAGLLLFVAYFATKHAIIAIED